MSQKNFQSAKIALLKMITTETFENNRLPSEATLAKKLRVSIVTLRQALSLLAAEGYITKRQGLGNFVHESALNQHMRTDLTYCVENLLLISGYQVQINSFRIVSLLSNIISLPSKCIYFNLSLHIGPNIQPPNSSSCCPLPWRS